MKLHHYTKLVAGATLVLIVAGGLVTSTGSGLAVPDWPLSYGMLFPPMVGGILYEHGHRMIAGTVAAMVAVMALWLKLREPRRWVRRLGALALAAVLAQALLGGLTVIFLLPDAISIAHALLAQTFFCIVVTIALVTSPRWEAGRAGSGRARADAAERMDGVGEMNATGTPDSRAGERAGWSAARGLALATFAAIYVQLILGALVRHMDAALAIPDFPLAFGRLIPPLHAHTVAIQFAHRAWALVVVGVVVATAWHVLRARGRSTRLARPAGMLLALVLVQVLLGAATIWSRRAVPFATAHVAVGATLLATSLVLAIRVTRASGLSMRGAVRGTASDALAYASLTKPRIVMLVVLTALLGLLIGERTGSAGMAPLRAALALLGIALVAGGSNALNMCFEREQDALMERTRRRPLPAGRLGQRGALVFSTACAVGGVALLLVAANALTALLGALAVAMYGFAYTPLKRKTPWCVYVGAVPGALPPVLGWTAARGTLGAEAAILFAILFLWQIPHFLAIAWIYRADYERGGFKMLPVVEPDGARTARQAVLGAIALVLVSLAPVALDLAGRAYLAGALALGAGFVASAIAFAIGRGMPAARILFAASIIYLPALLGLLAASAATAG